MAKNQLFKKIPSKELILKLVNLFGLHNFEDTRSFSRKELIKMDTVLKISLLKDELDKYYLPCKARTYLNDLNEKNVVTVLRQCLRTQGYTVNSREKYLKGEKFIIYNICLLEYKKYVSVSTTIEINKTAAIITFD